MSADVLRCPILKLRFSAAVQSKLIQYLPRSRRHTSRSLFRCRKRESLAVRSGVNNAGHGASGCSGKNDSGKVLLENSNVSDSRPGFLTASKTSFRDSLSAVVLCLGPPGHSRHGHLGQLATGGADWSWWRAAALNGWHEPCDGDSHARFCERLRGEITDAGGTPVAASKMAVRVASNITS
jgi:hypothetical protein